MSNPALANKSNLLEFILEVLTEKPRNWLIFSIVLGGLIFSVVSVVISLFIFTVTHLLKLPTLWVICLGILLILCSWMSGVSFYAAHLHSHMILNHYFYGNKISFSPLYVYLSALPYGLLLGGILAFIVQWNGGFTQ